MLISIHELTLTCKNSKKIALNSGKVGVLNQRLSWENVDLDQEMPLVSREARCGDSTVFLYDTLFIIPAV